MGKPVPPAKGDNTRSTRTQVELVFISPQDRSFSFPCGGRGIVHTFDTHSIALYQAGAIQMEKELCNLAYQHYTMSENSVAV